LVFLKLKVLIEHLADLASILIHPMLVGKYSKTNIFATDGILYKEENENLFEFEFTSKNSVLSGIKNKLEFDLLHF
jgi:hypothetical protein